MDDVGDPHTVAAPVFSVAGLVGHHRPEEREVGVAGLDPFDVAGIAEAGVPEDRGVRAVALDGCAVARGVGDLDAGVAEDAAVLVAPSRLEVALAAPGADGRDDVVAVGAVEHHLHEAGVHVVGDRTEEAEVGRDRVLVGRIGPGVHRRDDLQGLQDGGAHRQVREEVLHQVRREQGPDHVGLRVQRRARRRRRAGHVDGDRVAPLVDRDVRHVEGVLDAAHGVEEVRGAVDAVVHRADAVLGGLGDRIEHLADEADDEVLAFLFAQLEDALAHLQAGGHTGAHVPHEHALVAHHERHHLRDVVLQGEVLGDLHRRHVQTFLEPRLRRRRVATGLAAADLGLVVAGRAPRDDLALVEDGDEGDEVGQVNAAVDRLVAQEEVAVIDPHRGVVGEVLEHVLDGDRARRGVQVGAAGADDEIALRRENGHDAVGKLEVGGEAHVDQVLLHLLAEELHARHIDGELARGDGVGGVKLRLRGRL